MIKREKLMTSSQIHMEFMLNVLESALMRPKTLKDVDKTFES